MYFDQHIFRSSTVVNLIFKCHCLVHSVGTKFKVIVLTSEGRPVKIINCTPCLLKTNPEHTDFFVWWLGDIRRHQHLSEGSKDWIVLALFKLSLCERSLCSSNQRSYLFWWYHATSPQLTNYLARTTSSTRQLCFNCFQGRALHKHNMFAFMFKLDDSI